MRTGSERVDWCLASLFVLRMKVTSLRSSYSTVMALFNHSDDFIDYTRPKSLFIFIVSMILLLCPKFLVSVDCDQSLAKAFGSSIPDLLYYIGTQRMSWRMYFDALRSRKPSETCWKQLLLVKDAFAASELHSGRTEAVWNHRYHGETFDPGSSKLMATRHISPHVPEMKQPGTRDQGDVQ